MPEDSPAAYALGPVHGHTVTVQASLSSTHPTLTQAEIRAVDNVIDPRGPYGCLGLIRHLLRRLLRVLLGNVLASVAEFRRGDAAGPGSSRARG